MAPKTERFDRLCVVSQSGDVDAANALAVHDELVHCMGPETDRLVVDLGDTRFIDSAGLDMFMRLSERLSERRVRLVLVIPPDSALRRLAEIVGLEQAISLCSSLDEALVVARGN
jgi:anti-anti-sigma factor